MTKPTGINLLTDTASLTAINGEPSVNTTVKKITQLERHSRNFIARSPFCLLATSSKEGCDASPRGDAPGFVHCLDDTTLLLPERPGNKLADSMKNIINDPEMGLRITRPILSYLPLAQRHLNSPSYLTLPRSISIAPRPLSGLDCGTSISICPQTNYQPWVR